MELRLRPSFADDSRVVGTLVIVRETRQDLAGAMHAIGLLFAELIGDRQQQRHEGSLVLRFYLEDIETNAFGRGRIVEEAVALRLVQGCGNALARDWLQFHQ